MCCRYFTCMCIPSVCAGNTQDATSVKYNSICYLEALTDVFIIFFMFICVLGFFFRELGLLEEFKGNYSNEIWPKVHKFLAAKIEPFQYTEYN